MPSVAHHIAAILDTCRALGATVTSAPGSRCYTTQCSYGTPSRRTWFDREAQEWRTVGPVDDVIVYRAEWPMEPIPGRDPWEKRTTGPTVHEIARAMGIGCPIAGMAPLPAHVPGSGVSVLMVYEHAALLEENGAGGRGLVLAQGRRPSRVAVEDERGTPHLYTDESGDLRIGQFAV